MPSVFSLPSGSCKLMAKKFFANRQRTAKIRHMANFLFPVVEGSGEYSESGQASLALATNFVSKSIFNHEENECTIHTDDYADDFAPTYFFMAKGSKVSHNASSSDSSDCEHDDYKKNPVTVNFPSLPLNNKLLWKSFKNC